MITVAEFIAAEAAKPFAWGETDCCKTLDRWVACRKGYSPLVLAGCDYADEAGARAIMERHQNMFFALTRVAEIDRAEETNAPVMGDVAAIVLDGGKVCAAIHAGKVWFSRDEDGLIGAPVETTRVLKAWRVP